MNTGIGYLGSCPVQAGRPWGSQLNFLHTTAPEILVLDSRLNHSRFLQSDLSHSVFRGCDLSGAGLPYFACHHPH
jgi:hypothetical protein